MSQHFKTSSITGVVKWKENDIAGYVAYKEFKVLFGKPEDRRLIGRPRHKSEVSTKTDIKDTAIV
jgi:hypothetical protein